MLILSGSACYAPPKQPSADPRPFARVLRKLATAANLITMLHESADSHPLVLSKGDVIGAVEHLMDRPSMNSVIAGTFFKSPETKSRINTTVLHVPEGSLVLREAAYRSITEGTILLNHILLSAIHEGDERINEILACCFAGLLPAYRAFYCQAGTRSVRVVDGDRCHAQGNEDESYICLSRIDPKDDLVGIELSTQYLYRCFGLLNPPTLTTPRVSMPIRSRDGR